MELKTKTGRELAMVNSFVAGRLDAHSEGGGFLTASNFEQILGCLARNSGCRADELLQTMQPLHQVVKTTDAVLSDMDAQNRPLMPSELRKVVDGIGQMKKELMRLGVHLESPEAFYFPLYEGSYLTLNLHTWDEGQYTSDHDHGDESGAIRVLRGHLTEDIYRDGKWLTVLRPCGRSYAFDETLIHRMGNPFHNYPGALSLHAYSGPGGGLTRVTSFQRMSDGNLSVLRIWRKGGAKGTAVCPHDQVASCGKEGQ